MSEHLDTLQKNGSGVHERAPVPPENRKTTRTLLPSSWIRREVEITLTDGGSVKGTLLDYCPAGPILVTSLSKAEQVRRVVSWDAVKSVDLRE